MHNLDSMRVDSTQHTHRGACAGWGRSRECSHQSDAQRRLRAEIRSSVRARCRLPRVARVSLSLRCARAPFGQRVREARIEGECASRRTLRLPLLRYQRSSRAAGRETLPSKGCFHTPASPSVTTLPVLFTWGELPRSSRERQSVTVSYFTVPPRAPPCRPSAGSPSGSAAPGLTQVDYRVLAPRGYSIIAIAGTP